MIEAQLICETLDRGMSVDAVVKETLSAIKSSDVYWNTAHNHIFSDMSEDYAEYMLYDTVAGLSPERKPATGTVS